LFLTWQRDDCKGISAIIRNGNLPTLANFYGAKIKQPASAESILQVFKLIIQGGIPLAVHGVLTHNGDKLKRGRNLGKEYFQLFLI
jgi:hypothetical protein